MGRAAQRNERTKSDHKVVKKCPECDKEIPSACKTCPMCKASVSGIKAASFILEQSKILSSGKGLTEKEDPPVPDPESPTKIRRTERVRRERPDFFNPTQVEKQVKKKKKRRKESTEIHTKVNTEASSPASESSNGKKRRGRPKSVSAQESVEKECITPPEDDFNVWLPPEKHLQYKVILAELNRKFYTQNFNPL